MNALIWKPAQWKGEEEEKIYYLISYPFGMQKDPKSILFVYTASIYILTTDMDVIEWVSALWFCASVSLYCTFQMFRAGKNTQMTLSISVALSFIQSKFSHM